MTQFHPPSLIESVLVLDGDAPVATVVTTVSIALESIGEDLIRSWRCTLDGDPIPWPPHNDQLARLEDHGKAPSIYFDGPAGGIDLHLFDDPALLPRFATPRLPA